MCMAKITVQNTEITIIAVNGDDYISLTDLARHKSDEPNAVIANWLRNRNTIEYLGIWEQLYNPDFKPTEFEGFRRQAGLNAFTLSPKKWTEATNAIGIIAKSGRYGGTAIKQNLIPAEVTPKQASIIYANEADVLNVAMFGMTAKQWREANPDLKGNIRDYATINELICLSNMENLNAVFIEQGISQGERLIKLNQIAIHQMRVLESDINGDRKLLK